MRRQQPDPGPPPQTHKMFLAKAPKYQSAVHPEVKLLTSAGQMLLVPKQKHFIFYQQNWNPLQNSVRPKTGRQTLEVKQQLLCPNKGMTRTNKQAGTKL